MCIRDRAHDIAVLLAVFHILFHNLGIQAVAEHRPPGGIGIEGRHLPLLGLEVHRLQKLAGTAGDGLLSLIHISIKITSAMIRRISLRRFFLGISFHLAAHPPLGAASAAAAGSVAGVACSRSLTSAMLNSPLLCSSFAHKRRSINCIKHARTVRYVKQQQNGYRFRYSGLSYLI